MICTRHYPGKDGKCVSCLKPFMWHEETIKRNKILLQEAANALRQARLLAADWELYTEGKAVLKKLISEGY